jgi:Zn-dependent peptidase ImmA (M78 family)
MRNHPEYKVKVSMKKVNEALDKVRIMPFDSNIADGMTDCEHDIIFYNRRAIKNWSIGYKKLVLLHELAHYFTKKVSGVSGAHCRT